MSADRGNSSARSDNDLDDVWRAAAALLDALERSCRRCTHVHMDAPVADPTVGFLIENERGLYAVMGPANDLENLLRDVPKTGTGNDDLIRQLRELFSSSIGVDFRVGGRVNAHQLFALREATEKAGKDEGLRVKRGRKPDTDPKRDKHIAETWASAQYKTFADLERELELKKGEGKRAVDRHRKRK